MTNQEKFLQIFGQDLKRQYSTKSWWEQEYINPQKSGKWIPVSERLPKDGTYLVTLEGINGKPRIDIMSFANDLNKVDEYDFPSHKFASGWYDYDSEWGYYQCTKVIAWMALPKPYKVESEE